MKKATIPSSNLIGSGSTPWHHPGSSPSSLSSGGSVSPPAVDPSPSKTGILGIQIANDSLILYLSLLLMILHI